MIQYVDRWDSIMDVYAEPPNWQRETFPNGNYSEGPLVEGRRHGDWAGYVNDRSVTTSYVHGMFVTSDISAQALENQ